MLQMYKDRGTSSDGADTKWPPQVELILSALETGQFSRNNRRETRRNPYRVRARLRLFSDPPLSSPWLIYTRDVHAKGLGFISPHRLPLGYGGILEIPGPEGGLLEINCTLFRCREAAPGWYEGSVYFHREQPEFALPGSPAE
jgi:hypothetical protein